MHTCKLYAAQTPAIVWATRMQNYGFDQALHHISLCLGTHRGLFVAVTERRLAATVTARHYQPTPDTNARHLGAPRSDRDKSDPGTLPSHTTCAPCTILTPYPVHSSACSDRDKNDPDARSDDAGPEPEALEVATMPNGRTYAFVGLERQGGVVIYDVTTPASARFVTW